MNEKNVTVEEGAEPIDPDMAEVAEDERVYWSSPTRTHCAPSVYIGQPWRPVSCNDLIKDDNIPF
jgi:hypothetical protein